MRSYIVKDKNELKKKRTKKKERKMFNIQCVPLKVVVCSTADSRLDERNSAETLYKRITKQ